MTGRLTDFDRENNYYRLLAVDPVAPSAIIRNAHRVMMLELGGHPDAGGSHEHAVLLNRAREILLDPDLRFEYDHYWAALELERRAADDAYDAEVAGPRANRPAAGTTAEDRARLHRLAQEIELRSGFVSAVILQRRLGIGAELAEELVAQLGAEREAEAARLRPDADSTVDKKPPTALRRGGSLLLRRRVRPVSPPRPPEPIPNPPAFGTALVPPDLPEPLPEPPRPRYLTGPAILVIAMLLLNLAGVIMLWSLGPPAPARAPLTAQRQPPTIDLSLPSTASASGAPPQP